MRLSLKGLSESVLGNALWTAIYGVGGLAFVWVTAHRPLAGYRAVAVHIGVGACAALSFVAAARLIARWRAAKLSSFSRPKSEENQLPPSAPANVEIAPPPSLTLNAQEQARLDAFLRAERATAALWEYRYLNYYLVLHTQRVLDWLATRPTSATINLYEAHWSTEIPNAAERWSVLNALLNHHLIQIDGQMIEVTPKGQEYRETRGPLPPPPQTSSSPHEEARSLPAEG